MNRFENSEELGVVGYSIQNYGKGIFLELRLKRDYMEKIEEDGYDRLSWKHYTEEDTEKTRKNKKP